MTNVLAAALPLQFVDDLLYVLRRIATCDEHGVARCDHNEIVNSDCGNKRPVAAQIAIAHMRQQHVAAHHIVVVALSAISQSAPQDPTSLQPISTGTMAA